MDVKSLFQEQKAYFQKGETRLLSTRRENLQRLERTLRKREPDILAALSRDLGRPAFEAYAADLGIVLQEIRHARSNVKAWSARRKVKTPLVSFPSASFIHPEPYGVCLVISPWNFPFLLSLCPLVGALAAGCCVMLKPSSQTGASSRLIEQIIQETFPPNQVAVVPGGRDSGEALLTLPFDKIFFTGSPETARKVLKAAAEHLTPVTLELGGKNPCIVDESADISLAAKRIIWGKCFNAGQSCIAPDYVVAHHRIREKLILAMKDWIIHFLGPDPSQSPDFGRIVNDRQFQRLTGLLARGRLLTGGPGKAEERYLPPTLIDGVTWEDPVMQEEIFGPILPILEFRDLAELLKDLQSRPQPLAFYFFSKDRINQERVLQGASFGGGCLNDVMFQFIGPHLPFGGVGSSGMGRYHGKDSFAAFSHYKSILRNHFFFDIPLRYAPYGKKLFWLKKILG
jgi:aldehyde dehydrogenase (NAD+)